MEIENTFSPEKYVRLFEFRNYPLFHDSLWLQYWKELGALCINVNNLRTCYIPHIVFLESLKKGKDLFRSPDKIKEYILKFNEVEKELLEVSKSILNDESNLQKFKDIIKKWFYYYAYTDFLYTDDAQTEIEKNFPDFGRFKENKRATINKIAVGENSYLMQFLSNYSNKNNIPFKNILLYTIDEIIENKKVNVSDRKEHLMYHTDNLHIITGNKAVSLANKFRKIKLKKGRIAREGFKIGKAFVFHNDMSSTSNLSEILNSMSEGDIFITETTSPELMPFCKKAGGIITNQGGIMSHAAIIARELGIPCIVGLDTATHYFKNRDIVEVDANKGIIRILERIKD